MFLGNSVHFEKGLSLTVGKVGSMCFSSSCMWVMCPHRCKSFVVCLPICHMMMCHHGFVCVCVFRNAISFFCAELLVFCGRLCVFLSMCCVRNSMSSLSMELLCVLSEVIYHCTVRGSTYCSVGRCVAKVSTHAWSWHFAVCAPYIFHLCVCRDVSSHFFGFVPKFTFPSVSYFFPPRSAFVCAVCVFFESHLLD